MNYGQVKNQVLQLLNQYSVAGDTVAPSYNNQQDYINRMPALVNDAVLEIATTARKIPAQLVLTTAVEEGEEPSVAWEEYGDRIRFTMPEDFYQFKTGDTFVQTNDGHVFHTNVYSMQGRKYLLIPKREFDEGRTYEITYYRYPTLLAAKPADTDELDNIVETHYAVPFYVAAFLVMHDDAFLYSAFYNKYEDKLAKMGAGVSVELGPVGDAYAFNAGESYET